MSAPVFDNQPMTKREVLIAREAFQRGAYLFREGSKADANDGVRRGTLSPNDGLEMFYPLPKVTRPRVVRSEPDGMGWRCVDGRIEFRLWAMDESEAWKDAAVEGEHEITPKMVALWADLLANPTEEVDA